MIDRTIGEIAGRLYVEKSFPPEARERIRFWIKHYNHKRPHQGIGGLCPADRFFEIQTALRQTIEAGIKRLGALRP